jgi:hypothetical protein
MTFIASVVARDGVAVIADSLVTSSRPVIELNDFIKFVSEKTNGETQIKIDVDELYTLFRSKDSHTKDYEEKLFQYDKFTAITTAGNAIINKKRIREIIENKVSKNETNKKYGNWSFEEKVKNFCIHIENELKEHLQNDYRVGRTIFILTHFDKVHKKTIIYKVETNECTRDDINKSNFQLINTPKLESFKVVCDGQNRISENILYGGIGNMYSIINETVKKIKNDFGITDEQISADYISKTAEEFIPLINEDIHITKLSPPLSVSPQTTTHQMELMKSFVETQTTAGKIIVMSKMRVNPL